MALLGVKKPQRPAIVAVGLFGAALIYGDGAITPAISVLSALEALNMVTPALQPYVVPAAVAILLRAVCDSVTGHCRPGHFFGPVMLVWFLAIATMGITGIGAASFRGSPPSIRLRFVLPVLTRATGFGCWARCFSASPAPRHFMPIWAISAGDRSNLPGSPSCFPKPDPELCGQTALVLEGATTDGNIFLSALPAFF